jgi:hypothetical protein
MNEYVVYRHGWDEVNQNPAQGVPEKMPVLRVEAASADEACRLAAQRVPVAPSQHLSAEPAQEVDAKEHDISRRVEALPSLEEQNR